MSPSSSITIRAARPEDRSAVLRLAALDDRPAPGWDVMLAFEGPELVAARGWRATSSGVVSVADPFRRTAAAAAMLELRAGQLAA